MPNQNGNSVIDPYTYAFYPTFPDNNNTTGLTQVSPVAASGQNIEVWVSFGNSIVANSITDTPGSPSGYYTPSQTLVQNLYLGNGALYSYKEPIVGIGTLPLSCVGGRLGDMRRLNGKCDRFVYAPCGINGTFASEWVPGAPNQFGGPGYFTRCLTILRRLAAVGLTPDYIDIHFGENEANAGGAEAANIGTNVGSIISGIQSAGFTSAPFYISRSTFIGGGLPAASTTVLNAMNGLVNGTSIIGGASTNSLTGAWRSDGTHFNFTTGSPAFAQAIYDTLP
jgi:hypothetical protein